MKWTQIVLGKFFLFLDQTFTPSPLQRPEDYQRKVDQQTRKMVLYQFQACPFCIKVRRVIRQLNLKIELRDANQNPEDAKALVEGGGLYQVPCLRIEKADGSHQWMYESSDIIRFLRERFSE